MLQDIPQKLDLTYQKRSPASDDFVLIYHEGRVLLKAADETGPKIPTYRQLIEEYGSSPVRYLFSLDDRAFFLAKTNSRSRPGFTFEDLQIFRILQPSWQAFAGVTAAHLAAWYAKNRFCGQCGGTMSPSPVERAMTCGSCGLINYPSIAPVVIVGVIDGDRLLMTRYAAGAYRRPALVAGFVEVGETFEDAIRREVFEEVGLKVKNIRYYRSQPWAFSQSLLAGFFADLDGPDQVTVDYQELSEAFWLNRADLPTEDSNISLTYEMIDAFRLGRVPGI